MDSNFSLFLLKYISISSSTFAVLERGDRVEAATVTTATSSQCRNFSGIKLCFLGLDKDMSFLSHDKSYQTVSHGLSFLTEVSVPSPDCILMC